MVVPFIALILVVVIVILFMVQGAKNKDKGNRPGT